MDAPRRVDLAEFEGKDDLRRMSPRDTVKLASMSMATRFEIVLHGADPVWLRAVGEEALREVARLDDQLSFYHATSDVCRLNRQAHERPVVVDGLTFDLLCRARDLCARTHGAFDPTVGPLMRCWGLTGTRGRVPLSGELAEARRVTGMHLIELNERDRSVRYREEGVEIDLGGIGKGFAIDEAIRIMRDAGVPNALIHGGTSTVSVIGRGVNEEPWRVAIGTPIYPAHTAAEPSESLSIVELVDCSLSVSDVAGKFFESDGVIYGHVIDPRTGEPSRGVSLAAVTTRSAADADALTTALLVADDLERLNVRRSVDEMKMFILDERGETVCSDFVQLESAAEVVAG